MGYPQKIMDHTAYPKRLKRLTEGALRFTIMDAHNAIEAMPDNPNCGYYWDEISYCWAELRRRKLA